MVQGTWAGKWIVRSESIYVVQKQMFGPFGHLFSPQGTACKVILVLLMYGYVAPIFWYIMFRLLEPLKLFNSIKTS